MRGEGSQRSGGIEEGEAVDGVAVLGRGQLYSYKIKTCCSLCRIEKISNTLPGHTLTVTSFSENRMIFELFQHPIKVHFTHRHVLS